MASIEGKTQSVTNKLEEGYDKYHFREADPKDFEMKHTNSAPNSIRDRKGDEKPNVKEVFLKKQEREKGERKDFHKKLFKTPKETHDALLAAAQKKVMIPIDKLIYLGLLSGVFISFGGIFALSVTQGVPNSDPGYQKFLLTFTFPIALALIVYFGGELFTGNTMFMTLGLLHKKVTWKGLTLSWVISYFSNFLGAVFGAYFFGYLTELFVANPYLANVQAIAVKKVSLSFQVAFFRGFAANWLVNLAIYVGVVAEDVTGKTIGMFLIIGTFATSGFEHCIANMYYVCQSLMYGADTTFGIFIYKNLIPVTLGNALGGVVMGLSLWYIYGTKQNISKPGPELFSITCLV